jgi:uncharacterized protein YecE (DUF72 family)
MAQGVLSSTQTKKLEYYAQFFDTVELDATFYEKFYKYMTKDTFRTMTKVTPDNFQFSIKVPEIVTHDKRLDVKKAGSNRSRGVSRKDIASKNL